MYERAKNNFALTKKKIGYAEDFFKKDDLNEAIHYIWIVFENCINIIKDIKNQKPIKEHKTKIDVFDAYYNIGILKQNYSIYFELLEKLRVRADFGDYALAPKIPNKEKVKEYLDKAKELFEETKKIVEGI